MTEIPQDRKAADASALLNDPDMQRRIAEHGQSGVPQRRSVPKRRPRCASPVR